MTTYTQVSMNKFIKEHISLDADVTKTARNSRDFLYEQLKALPDKAENFPRLYPNKEIYNYGSFSRKTKIRPLDDIDFMLVFAADGGTYESIDNTIKIRVPESATNLYKLRDDNGYLSSRKVANKIKNNISKVSQYQKAEIRSNQEAVILNLISYDWSFDIIPAFITTEEIDGRSYYLIPDGDGHWKKTDPRIDQKRVTDANKNTEFNVLEFIRIIKFWNIEKNIKISSYLIENIVLNYFESRTIWNTSKKTQLMRFFEYLQTAIWLPVEDPKGLQGNLNDLEDSKKQTVEKRAKDCEEATRKAIAYEEAYDYEKADNQWRIVFGDEYV
ncbi:SMODS domain-containing nucleotidyltransferase [Rummeliibacillus pycnus]|uniref:SMODS domain-containing nucleotidyltransferase n=1 Tax=Rummeliibacillus pycnus TaxID=101070 RepID=UPI000C9CCDE2|nr:nucleotidyltransferase [Rummeliibacillus pycnus]